MLRRTTRLVAAAFLAAAAGVAVSPAPAPAAACSTSTGVTVVVDFHELGGGVQQVCDASGAGKYAAAQFGDAGFSLARVQRQPGFVCRVDGAPADDPCVDTPPADAYWGLWWSNGTSGTWTYSSLGVDSLKVPAGGSVALSWNGSSTKSPPGATPPANASASPSSSPSSGSSSPQQPSPSSQPSNPGGTSGNGSTAPDPTDGPSTGGASATPSAGASDTPGGNGKSNGTDGKGDRGRGTDKGKGDTKAGDGSGAPDRTDPTDTASSAPAGTSADPPSASGSSGGLPTWTGPAAVGALFAAAGGTALARRRRGTPGATGP